jgi:hypothetical protein
MMYVTAGATVLVLALTLPAGATEPVASPRSVDSMSAETSRAISTFEERMQSALAQRDRAALDKLLATPFLWVHASDGRVESRDVWLDAAARGMALSGQRSTRTEHGVTLTAFGGERPHTVIRVSRVRLRDAAGQRESWLRQTQTFVRESDGEWRIAAGQGVVMYEGAPLDPALHARYAGTYVIAPGRELKLEWEDGALLGTLPSGAQGQIFLASPTEEAVRTAGAGNLRFTLDADGTPTGAALMRAGREQWSAKRAP